MGLPSSLNYLKWIFSFPAYPAHSYFLARESQSCDVACANKNLACDLVGIRMAAADSTTCKRTLANLGQTTTSGGQYPDQGDYSGCTYSATNSWHMLMKPGNTGLPTCAATPRGNRQRVCACKKGKNTRSMSCRRQPIFNARICGSRCRSNFLGRKRKSYVVS